MTQLTRAEVLAKRRTTALKAKAFQALPRAVAGFRESIARVKQSAESYRPPTIEQSIEGGHRGDPVEQAERENRILRRFRVMAIESGLRRRKCTEDELFSVFNDQSRHESLHQMELMISMTPQGYWERRGL